MKSSDRAVLSKAAFFPTGFIFNLHPQEELAASQHPASKPGIARGSVTAIFADCTDLVVFQVANTNLWEKCCFVPSQCKIVFFSCFRYMKIKMYIQRIQA